MMDYCNYIADDNMVTWLGDVVMTATCCAMQYMLTKYEKDKK